MVKLNRLWRAGALICVLSVAAAVNAVHAGTNTDRDRIVAVLKNYERVLNASDVPGVLKLYAPNSVFMPQYSPSQVGTPAIRRAYTNAFKTIDIDVKFEIVEVRVLGNGWAFVRTNSIGTVKILATGALKHGRNQELFVLQKQKNGAWKIARYAFSSTARPKT